MCGNILNHCGGNSEGETPVLIPNTEVKPFSAQGTCLEADREIESLPHPLKGYERSYPFFFCLCVGGIEYFFLSLYVSFTLVTVSGFNTVVFSHLSEGVEVFSIAAVTGVRCGFNEEREGSIRLQMLAFILVKCYNRLAAQFHLSRKSILWQSVPFSHYINLFREDDRKLVSQLGDKALSQCRLSQGRRHFFVAFGGLNERAEEIWTLGKWRGTSRPQPDVSGAARRA